MLCLLKVQLLKDELGRAQMISAFSIPFHRLFLSVLSAFQNQFFSPSFSGLTLPCSTLFQSVSLNSVSPSNCACRSFCLFSLFPVFSVALHHQCQPKSPLQQQSLNSHAPAEDLHAGSREVWTGGEHRCEWGQRSNPAIPTAIPATSTWASPRQGRGSGAAPPPPPLLT